MKTKKTAKALKVIKSFITGIPIEQKETITRRFIIPINRLNYDNYYSCFSDERLKSIKYMYIVNKNDFYYDYVTGIKINNLLENKNLISYNNANIFSGKKLDEEILKGIIIATENFHDYKNFLVSELEKQELRIFKRSKCRESS